MVVEVADIIRDNINLMFFSSHIRKVLTHLKDCRTPKLGIHSIKRCDNKDCSHKEYTYNSCRDRNCPKCQGSKKNKWILQRLKEVLPVNYYHVVFTIPSSLRKLFLYNDKLAYNLLFKAVSETLNEVAAKNKKLKAKIGFIAILHTWTQRLFLHPHLHCIIPGGGISLETGKWKSCDQNYLLPQKVLSIVFKGKLLQYIEKAYKKGLISYPITKEEHKYLNSVKSTLVQASRSNWVVYTKKAFGGPSGVLNYLGNYTHRIAISNYRIKSYKNKTVTFSWKDRKDNNKTKYERISAQSFIRRFSLHILPERFMKIRYYGFMATSNKKENISLCKKLIIESGAKLEYLNDKYIKRIEHKLEQDNEPKRCPICKKGHLIDHFIYEKAG